MSGSFRKTIEGWITEDKMPPVAGFVLSTASVLYGMGVAIRLFLYKRSIILKRKKLMCVIISIGNITVGGTGKTPMTMHIAKRFVKEGTRVVILSRGYKGKNTGIGLVSDGNSLLMGPGEAGDEPYLMAKKLLNTGSGGVPVVVCADRVKAGEFAIKKFSPDLLLLDDGFQHVQMARDIDLVLVDSKTELAKERLLPRGRLREPAKNMFRARLIMIKDREGIKMDPIIRALDKPTVAFSFAPEALYALKGEDQLEVSALQGKNVFLFSGVASPASFLKTVEESGATVIGSRAFSDHYNFSAADIEQIKREAAGADMIVTTEKDAVRLEGFSSELEDFYALAIKVVMEKEENFFRNIR